DRNLFFSVGSSLASWLGTIALAVAILGLYSAMSNLVRGRTREMGIRMALGADRRRIISLLVAEGLVPIYAGLAVGLVCALLIRLGAPVFSYLHVAVDLGVFLLIMPA